MPLIRLIPAVLLLILFFVILYYALSTYSIYNFPDHSVPLFSFFVRISAVEVFLYYERIIETAHFTKLFDQIYPETLVTVVAF